MALIVCPKCGQKISDQASCCPKCGHKFMQETIMAAAKKKSLLQITASKGKWFIFVGIIFLVIAVAIRCSPMYKFHSDYIELCHTWYKESIESLVENEENNGLEDVSNTYGKVADNYLRMAEESRGTLNSYRMAICLLSILGIVFLFIGIRMKLKQKSPDIKSGKKDNNNLEEGR